MYNWQNQYIESSYKYAETFPLGQKKSEYF